MIRLSIVANQARIEERIPITTGSARVYQVAITFDATWDGLARTAVFEAGDIRRELLLGPGNTCTIPWEPLVADNVGKPLLCGVYGTDGAGTRLPTVWATISPGLLRGTDPGGPALEPTPDAYAQVLNQMGDLSQLDTQDKSSLVAAINEVFTTGGGASVAGAQINEGGRLILTLSDGTEIDAGDARGSKGDKGDTGAQGPKGETGAQGPAGAGAYEAALSGGYTGSESEFNADLAAMDGLAAWFASL